MKMKSIKKKSGTSALTQTSLLITLPAALALSGLFYGVVVYLLFPDSYIAEIFGQRGWVPYSTTILFAWGMILVVFAYQKVLREDTTFQKIQATLIEAHKINQENAPALMAKIESEDGKKGGQIASNRFVRTLRRIADGIRKPEEVSELLRDQADIDHAIFQANHIPLKFFIWVIPVLGFIGTVLGVSSAIGGFSSILGKATSFPEVKGAIGLVSLNLGVAFETTLLALIKTAILMFATTMVQRKERTLLISMDEFCADDLMKRVEPLGKIRKESSEISALTEVVEVLTNKISTWDPRFSQTLDKFFDQLTTASQKHLEESHKIADQIQTTLEKHSKDIADALRLHLESAATTIESVQTTMQQGLSNIEQASEKGAKSATTVAASIEVLSKSVNELGVLQTTLQENIRSLTALKDFNRCLDNLRGSVDQLPRILADLKRPRDIHLVEVARDK